jgi:hypothetical protein
VDKGFIMPQRPPTKEELQDLVKKTRELIKSSDLEEENQHIIQSSKLAEIRRLQSKKVDPSLLKRPFTI